MPHLDSANKLEYKEKGYTIVKKGNKINVECNRSIFIYEKKKALDEKQISLLHEEADILTNYLISEGLDLVQDLGCVVGKKIKIIKRPFLSTPKS